MITAALAEPGRRPLVSVAFVQDQRLGDADGGDLVFELRDPRSRDRSSAAALSRNVSRTASRCSSVRAPGATSSAARVLAPAVVMTNGSGSDVTERRKRPSACDTAMPLNVNVTIAVPVVRSSGVFSVNTAARGCLTESFVALMLQPGGRSRVFFVSASASRAGWLRSRRRGCCRWLSRTRAARRARAGGEAATATVNPVSAKLP